MPSDKKNAINVEICKSSIEKTNMSVLTDLLGDNSLLKDEFFYLLPKPQLLEQLTLPTHNILIFWVSYLSILQLILQLKLSPLEEGHA
jgi:hypothetical protein